MFFLWGFLCVSIEFTDCSLPTPAEVGVDMRGALTMGGALTIGGAPGYKPDIGGGGTDILGVVGIIGFEGVLAPNWLDSIGLGIENAPGVGLDGVLASTCWKAVAYWLLSCKGVVAALLSAGLGYYGSEWSHEWDRMEYLWGGGSQKGIGTVLLTHFCLFSVSIPLFRWFFVSSVYSENQSALLHGNTQDTGKKQDKLNSVFAWKQASLLLNRDSFFILATPLSFSLVFRQFFVFTLLFYILWIRSLCQYYHGDWSC